MLIQPGRSWGHQGLLGAPECGGLPGGDWSQSERTVLSKIKQKIATWLSDPWKTAPGCPFRCLHYERPLFAICDFLVLWMETNFPPLLTHLKNSGTSQVGIFCSDILSLFSKKQSLCCIFFPAKTFFFLLHLNPELTRKVSISIACPVNLHHWGYEKKKTFMFQQKSPDFQKIINTFKNYQRQLYKRIHEHSYIKESLDPEMPILADFQIACE